MIILTEGGGKYNISYRDLREHYLRLCEMNDQQFLSNLPDALHVACIISWLKEIGNDYTVGDDGLIHELVHLLKPDGTTTPLRDIRKMFKQYLKLH